MEKTFKEILEAVRILDFFHSKGFTKIDESKSSKTWLKLKNPTSNEKIIINTTNGFYRNIEEENDNGNIINFLMNRVSGKLQIVGNADKSKKALAINELKEFIGMTSYHTSPEFKGFVNQKQNIIKDYSIEELKNEYDFKKTYHHEYFTNRGFHKKTINEFKDTISIVRKKEGNFKKWNIAFNKYNEKGDLKGLCIRYKYKSESKKINVGSSNYLWHTTINKKTKYSSIIISENPFDSLAYYQMNSPLDNCILTSIDGQINLNKINYIKQLKNRVETETKTESVNIKLCYDKDKEGLKYTLKTISAFLNEEAFDFVLKDNIIYLKTKLNLLEDNEPIKYKKLVKELIEENRNINLEIEITKSKKNAGTYVTKLTYDLEQLNCIKIINKIILLSINNAIFDKGNKFEIITPNKTDFNNDLLSLKKKGGRPNVLNKTDEESKVISVRFNIDIANTLKSIADKEGHNSVSSLIEEIITRNTKLKIKKTTKVKKPTINNENYLKLVKLVNELASIKNNLNQIAKNLNINPENKEELKQAKEIIKSITELVDKTTK